uniref:Uncharacterized protein n=1 Tax=Rhodosorus marinus TaxID=101924 RepID=A0A7S0BM36_9RHOD
MVVVLLPLNQETPFGLELPLVRTTPDQPAIVYRLLEITDSTTPMILNRAAEAGVPSPKDQYGTERNLPDLDDSAGLTSHKRHPYLLKTFVRVLDSTDASALLRLIRSSGTLGRAVSAIVNKEGDSGLYQAPHRASWR